MLMSQSKVTVGSVGYWGLMRIAQFVIICVGILFLIAEGRPFPWQLVVILVLWFLFAAYLDSWMDGFAEEDGLDFRQPVARQFLLGPKRCRASWFGVRVIPLPL